MAIYDPETTDPTFRSAENPTQDDWVVGAATTIGLTRSDNEDAFWADPARGFAVADGIGGNPGGRLAATTAIHSFASALEPQASMGDALTAAATAYKDVMVAREAAGFDRAGTTFVAMTATKLSTCTIVWCGDSRLYRFRDDGLELMTTDHSLGNELRSAGTSSDDNPVLAGVPLGALTRYLGADGGFEPDIRILTPQVGDRYLLCSDGVHGQLTTRVIGDVLSSTTCRGAAAALVGLADMAGGRDNATAVVAEALG